jgi:lysophospholipase L1-like esterase
MAVLGLCVAGIWRHLPSHTISQPAHLSDWSGGIAERQKMVKLSRLHHVAIVMFGDSQIAFASWPDLTGCTSISSRGVPGATARDLAQDARVVHELSARLVVIAVGINDLQTGRSPQELVHDVRQLVTNVGGRIALISILPVARWYKTPELSREIREANAGLKTIPGVQFVDLNSHFADSDGYMKDSLTTDGVHLRADGYAIWRNRIEKLVGEVCGKG